MLGSGEHRKFSMLQGRDIEPNNIINTRSPNGRISSAVGIASSRTHNGIAFHEGDLVVNVITSGERSNVHVQRQGHAAPFSPINSPAHSPGIRAFQSEACTPAPVQSAGDTPSPIPFLAADPPNPAPIHPSSALPVRTAPFVIPTTQVQQTDLAADACDCQCLCPFHFFGLPAVNLATTVDQGAVPTPKTLNTFASTPIRISSTAAAAPFLPIANDTLIASIAFPTSLDVRTSSTSVLDVPPIAFPIPPEDGVNSGTGVPITLLGDEASSIAELSTPNEPAPAAPTEIVSTNTDPIQPTTTEADATQPAATQATETAEGVAVTPEGPATLTDADFTQVTESAEFSAMVTDAAAETVADSTQRGLTVAPVETATTELEPASSDIFDINTLTLHSALTLRLGG
ncbi:hypothetical protein ACJ72_06396 [Emergomyces africanus]|uniref:Uncharacterized protein n=1 Tax=Emergomyces africanus TaxID=1955775 RepID=A0A1B7NR60_9EURO|nr:hypothetical protein ACJ72_06396 [Emergomyces africanus]